MFGGASEYCSFCIEPNIIHCLNRSLHHKHSEQEDKSGTVIDELLLRNKSQTHLKFVEVMLESEGREYLCQDYRSKEGKRQLVDLLEYYKYRIFVPLFTKSQTSDTVLTYYYDKLRHYYNTIKRKLNITVDPSCTNSLSYNSATQSNVSTAQELLKDIKKELDEDKKNKKIPSIMNYKSQSKALEELVSYLKLNSHFQHVKSLKTEDCFEQQSIFEETSHKKSTFKINIPSDSYRTSIKSKLFKKIIQGSSGKKTAEPVDAQRIPQRPHSRSIKIINYQQKESDFIQKPHKYRIKQIELKLNENKSANSLSKKKSNTKISSKHYSPYQRKSAASLEKVKGTTLQITKNTRSRSIENLKIKQDEALRVKESLLKMQVMKFQNQAGYRTVPTSPSARKTIKTGVEVTKNDNILSIRKKKLQALRQRATKK